MYGTTIRNYNNYTRTARTDDMNKTFFGKNKKTRKAKKDDFHKTRYIKIEENNEIKEENSNNFAIESKVSRKEFPIASVILTVVATMIFMLIGTGVIG